MKIIKTYILLLSSLIILLLASSSYAQENKTVHNKSFNLNQTQKPTNTINGTKYISGESYKTTGQPKVERSTSAKKKFLKSKGYKKLPSGYQVDHITPLSQGGKDVPANMQLITKEQHKQKTASERSKTSSSTKNTSTNYSTSKSTYKSSSKNYNNTKTTTYKSNKRSYKSTSTNTPKAYKSNKVSYKSKVSYKAPKYKSTRSSRRK